MCGSEYGSSALEYLERMKKEGSGYLERLGYVYLILGLIKDAVIDNERETFENDTELLSRLLLYINDNYGKNLSLSILSKVFGYHPGYISAYFKSHINIGISRYINVIRLKMAITLIEQKKYNITEIAMECGFASTRTFYRAFRNEFGCSPKEYLRDCFA